MTVFLLVQNKSELSNIDDPDSANNEPDTARVSESARVNNDHEDTSVETSTSENPSNDANLQEVTNKSPDYAGLGTRPPYVPPVYDRLDMDIN